MKTISASVRWPESTYAELVRRAEADGTTLADYIRSLVAEGLRSGSEDNRLTAMEARIVERIESASRAVVKKIITELAPVEDEA